MTRRSVWLPLVLTTALMLGACGSGDDPEEPSPDASASTGTPSGTPTEESPGAGDTPEQEPEDTGPPEVTGTIATGLEVPWGLTFLPDDSALVTERDSRRVLHLTERNNGKWRVREAGTVPEAAPAVEGGLLGIAASPDFDEDATVFIYVTTAQDNRVVRAEFDGDSLGSTTPVLTGIPKGYTHDGGRLAFGPDGHLYVSTGETGEPPLAQDRDSLAGKILRITPDGDPAPGNPSDDSPVWSWGHRNVQGLAFDDEDRLWASEFGDSTFDELNRIEPGGNYGWPLMEGAEMTGAGAVDGKDLLDPVVTWRTQNASPSGLAYADGSLWLGALRGTRLWQVRLAGDRPESVGHFVGEHGRLRTVATAPDGTLWVTTSNRDGRGTPGPDDDRILQVTP